MAGESNRSQAFAPGTAAIAEDGPPALFGVAAQETVLPFAADFRWLILSLHTLRISLARRISEPFRSPPLTGAVEHISRTKRVKEGAAA